VFNLPDSPGNVLFIGHRAESFLAASAFSVLLPRSRAWRDKTEALEYACYMPQRFEELAL
tara:strand:- start:56 stop:235 length:180 start_codon:yes stop_codon:yes gene_type:complete